MKRLAHLTLVVATVFMARALAAQDPQPADRHEIHSVALGANRPYMARTPNGYERSVRRHPGFLDAETLGAPSRSSGRM
jgi:hypothetical protein